MEGAHHRNDAVRCWRVWPARGLWCQIPSNQLRYRRINALESLTLDAGPQPR